MKAYFTPPARIGGPLAFARPPGGPRTPKVAAAPRNHSSKKGYTGSRAGLGRQPHGVTTRSGPTGPRAFGGSTQLPPRMRGTAPRVSLRPKAPSLFARVGSRMRRTAAAFGL
jgi:hypothetical protein